MADTKAVITVILAPRLLAQLDTEAKRQRRSRNNYINFLLESRHGEQDPKKETK